MAALLFECFAAMLDQQSCWVPRWPIHFAIGAAIVTLAEKAARCGHT
jgi:hypothetical protein